MSTHELTQPKLGFGVALIVSGFFGLLAAFALTLEKIAVLKDPGHKPGCDLSVLVSCAENLSSTQGSVLGFPNPLIGLMAWPVVIATGVLVVAKVRLPRWYWTGLFVGVLLAISLVVFLIHTSIFVLETLCPWCMVTWVATFVTLWLSGTYAVAGMLESAKPETAARVRGLSAWTTLATVVFCVVVLVIAQLQMDAVTLILRDLFG